MNPFQTSALASSLASTSLEGGERDGPTRLVAGVLSGTSADGIDVVLAQIEVEDSAGDGRLRLRSITARAFATEPIPDDLARRLRAVLDGGPLSIPELAVLDRDLGYAFGHAARRVADRHDVGELALVASHGQTIFHHDGDASLGKVTLQIGDGDYVAEAAGCPVVSDFRKRDCAAGGEGAPLVCLVDEVLFQGTDGPLAILNLGGMANWTWLPGRRADGPRDEIKGAIRGFDTGPAGALLDGMARELLDLPFDSGGGAALRGAANDALVEGWLEREEVRAVWGASGPRSTGRDTFGESFVRDLINSAQPGSTAPDLLASGCRFVAESTVRALAVTAPWQNRLGDAGPVFSVAMAGGGVHNAALMAELERALDLHFGDGSLENGPKAVFLGTSDVLGVPPDAREALAFAALGARALLGEPSTREGATGALAGRVLGKWSQAAVPGANLGSRVD